MAAKTQAYDFTLILGGIDDFTEDLANALYEAGCDDSTPAVINGVFRIDFTREAKSFPEAVISALRDVAKVAKQFPKLRVVRVENPDQEFLDLINCALALPPRIPSSFEKTLGGWLKELLRNKAAEDTPIAS
jgi:hypothetical protein